MNIQIQTASEGQAHSLLLQILDFTRWAKSTSISETVIPVLKKEEKRQNLFPLIIEMGMMWDKMVARAVKLNATPIHFSDPLS